MTTWFTSDSHFNHARILSLAKRTFPDVTSMNEALIRAWNERVSPHDDVWHLGDFAFHGADPTPTEVIFSRLNGHKRLVIGNHDDEFTMMLPWTEAPALMATINLDGQYMHLCHYAMRTWPRVGKGAWHLFGHSHGGMPGNSLSCDVGVDMAFTKGGPVSPVEIRRYLRTQRPFVPEDHHRVREL